MRIAIDAELQDIKTFNSYYCWMEVKTTNRKIRKEERL